MFENSEKEIKENKIINLHSGAILIENKVKLLSRQAWFYLVYKAFPNLQQQDEFEISLVELKKAIGYNSSNNKYLKNILKELVETSIEWNIFNKDKISWEINSLLAGCKIDEGSGICNFAFSPFIRKKLLNPEMYIKLDLLISKKFRSKHTLALYCFALDYLQVKNNFGKKNLTIEELRKLLGLDINEYAKVMNINQEIIKKAEKEINEIGDIDIKISPIRVENRKIIGFQFEMSIKNEYLDFYKNAKIDKKEIILESTQCLINNNLNQISQIQNIKKRDLIIPKSDEINKFLHEHKISITTDKVQKKLLELTNTISNNKLDEYLLFLIKYIKKESIKISFKNISGFFITLLKDDSQIYNYYFELSEKEKKDTIIQQKKLIKIEELIKEKVFNKYNENIKDGFENHLRKNIDMLENTLIDVIMKDNKGIINKSLILDLKIGAVKILISELEKYSDRFLYKKPDFEAWKNENINKETLKKIRFEVENNLN